MDRGTYVISLDYFTVDATGLYLLVTQDRHVSSAQRTKRKSDGSSHERVSPESSRAWRRAGTERSRAGPEASASRGGGCARWLVSGEPTPPPLSLLLNV